MAASDPTVAEEGALVKIVGIVREEGPMLEGPLSGRPCKAYQCELFVERESVARSHPVDFRASVPFSLLDGADAVEVRAERVGITLARDRFEPSVSQAGAAERARRLLAERGYGPDARAVSGSEGVLQVGERVAALGVARWMPAPGAGYRGSGRRLVLEAPPDGELVISDEPRTLR